MHIITGTIAYDFIMDFPDKFEKHILPDQLHKINLSFIVNKFEKRRGGTAGNVSYSLALLKTKHLLFSYAGKDFDDYKKAFTKLNIDTKGIKIDKKTYTSNGFAITDKSNNQIWGFFYGASDNIQNLDLSAVATKKDTVLIGPSGTKGTVSMIKQCVEKNISYIFDPGFTLTDISDSDLKKGVENAKIIIGNDYEIEIIKRRVKNFESITKNKTLITTLGAKGAVIEKESKKSTITAVKVKNAVDPTGAGDAFRAGLIAGLEREFDAVISAQMGSVAASFAVEKYGAQEHRYTLSDFKNRYRQTYKSLINL